MIQQGNSTRKLGVVGTLLVCTTAMVLPLVPGRQQTAAQSNGAKSPAPKPATQPGAQRSEELTTNQELFKKLGQRLPNLTFHDVPWVDVISNIHEATGIQFVFDWNALESVGISRKTSISIELNNLQAGTAVNRIIAAAAPKRTITLQYKDDAVKITVAPKPAAMVVRLEYNLPRLKFNHVGFGDVVDFLREVSGMNLLVDWKALEAAGIDHNTPISADLTNVKFVKALNAILAAVDGGEVKLGYRIDQDVITISTAEQLKKQVVIVQVYDIPSDFKPRQLIETIIDSIDPPSWKLRGGTMGDIRAENGRLIVTQTPVNQHAVANLLENVSQLLPSDHAK